MEGSGSEAGFRVRCRSCGRTVFSRVMRIGVREAEELREHLKREHPERGLYKDDAALGAILEHFDVHAAAK